MAARSFLGDNDVINITAEPMSTTMSGYAYVESPTLGASARILTADNLVFSFNASSLLEIFRQWESNPGIWTCSPGVTTGWHHYAFTYDGGSTSNDAILYVDGSAPSVTRASAPAGSIQNAASDVGLGNRSGGTGFAKLNGNGAFFALHNVILTPAEINQAKANGFVARGLVGYWPITGASPEPDQSGGGRNGVVTGTTVVAGPPGVPAVTSTPNLAPVIFGRGAC